MSERKLFYSTVQGISEHLIDYMPASSMLKHKIFYYVKNYKELIGRLQLENPNFTWKNKAISMLIPEDSRTQVSTIARVFVMNMVKNQGKNPKFQFHVSFIYDFCYFPHLSTITETMNYKNEIPGIGFVDFSVTKGSSNMTHTRKSSCCWVWN